MSSELINKAENMPLFQMDDCSIKEKNSDSRLLPILPVSVIELGKQGKRIQENHSKQSSRKNYSGFPSETAELCYSFYLSDKSTIFDPFAGWGERGWFANKYNKHYIGYDLSLDAIAKAKTDYNVFNFHRNSEVYEIPDFDGMITCPPYWNLEKYESENGLDKCKTFCEFNHRIGKVWQHCFDKAAGGSIFCIQVGNWRSKGVYYDLVYHTQKHLYDLGLLLIDNVVLSRRTVSKIKIMLPQAKRLKYSVNVHENLLVYKKPEI